MTGQSELALHFEAWRLICAYRRRDVLALHIPNGEKRDRRTAARLKAMGVRAGASDFLLIVSGEVHWIELKTANGRLSTEQRAFLEDAETARCSTHVVRSIEELAVILNSIGALRVRLTVQSARGDLGAHPVTGGAEALG